jgi:hypothetical protein
LPKTGYSVILAGKQKPMLQKNNGVDSDSSLKDEESSQSLRVVWIVFAVVLLIGVSATLYFLGNKLDTYKNSPIRQTKITSSNESQNRQNEKQTANDQELQKDRGDLEKFLQTPFNPETAQPGPQFKELNIRPGGKFRMTVNYSSVGDQKMSKGSVYVKLGSGLSLVPGSIKDEFMSNPAKEIGDGVFNKASREIKFGPGTTDSPYVELQPNQRGKLIFDVELSQKATLGETVRLYSYLSDEGGKTGKVDLVFFRVS